MDLPLQSLLKIFKNLDRECSGTVPRETLEKVLSNGGVIEGNQVVAMFFAASGKDPTAIVNYSDFANWIFKPKEVQKGNTPRWEDEPIKRQMSNVSNVSRRGSYRRSIINRASSKLSMSTEPYIAGVLQDNPQIGPQTPSIEELQILKPFVKVPVTFGCYRFKGKESVPWLAKYDLGPETLDEPSWTQRCCDAVAAAVASWAMSRGATMVCHWTQPLRAACATWRGSAPSRMVHALFNPGADGDPVCILDGTYLLHGEGDSRKMIDMHSPMWIRGDTLFIPSVFVNYLNSPFSSCVDPVLCEKTPLLRAMHAVSLASVRLLRLLGHTCSEVVPKIGLEQEFFLVTRAAYDRRPDLQRCGRTLFGHLPHGNDLYDTHSEAMNEIAQATMADIQSACFELGIHLRTRHRESAPNQYEYAPHFGAANAQIDENLVVMDLIEEIARKHGLAALLHEKPFMGVNGSGKHHNFSLATDTGFNLFNEKHCNCIQGDRLGPYEAFPIIMAAVCKAVYQHGNLMMASVACPGNDFRLSKSGGNESPPTVVSVHLGESLTEYLTMFANSTEELSEPYAVPKSKISLGIPCIDEHGIEVSSETRNRTAFFPYAGRRFELRSPGSSQNHSMINVVLCSIIATSFNDFSDAIEKGSSPRDIASASLKECGLKAIYNGSNYDPAWHAEAEKRGLGGVNSIVEGICQWGKESTITFFEKLGVMTRQELVERTDVTLENYVITTQIEADCTIAIARGQLVPAGRSAGLDEGEAIAPVLEAVSELETELGKVTDMDDMEEQACAACDLRLKTMVRVRELCDNLEALIPAAQWPLASYRELLFDDMINCR